mgnify:CR=1 FL=1
MRAEAPRLRRPTEGELAAIEEFARQLGVPLAALASKPYVLEVPGAKYHDVFDVPEGAEAVVKRLSSAYSAGYYIGSLQGERFVPGLPLALRLQRLCGVSMECIVVDTRGAKVFLYGMPVEDQHILKFYEGVRVVLDPLGEAIGWGVGVKVTLKNVTTRRVDPVKDLGWYLRRGG